MLMNENFSSEWWLWRINRCAADFILHPTELTESLLSTVIDEYRRHYEQYAQNVADEHERVMDYR